VGSPPENDGGHGIAFHGFSRLNIPVIERFEYLRQVVTYFVLGGFAAVTDLALLFVLVDVLGVYYLAAAAMSFVLVATMAFFLHKNLTFRSNHGNNQLRYVIFLFGAVSGLLWSLTLLFVFVELLGFPYLGAAVIVKFIVFAWNFSVNKYVTFRRLPISLAR
jgi:dolichol-phosphate mannosyltransferase